MDLARLSRGSTALLNSKFCNAPLGFLCGAKCYRTVAITYWQWKFALEKANQGGLDHDRTGNPGLAGVERRACMELNFEDDNVEFSI